MVNLEAAIRKEEQDEYWSIRGKAVQAYAKLEQALCRLFAKLTATTPEVASIIFYRIVDADTRNGILESLWKKRFGERFYLFRDSLFYQLRPIEIELKEIVHWNFVTNINLDEARQAHVSTGLKPPMFWEGVPRSEGYKASDDLIAFINRCNFYSRLCSVFYAVVLDEHSRLAAKRRQAWLDVFVHPITYPPSVGHPLFRESSVTADATQTIEPLSGVNRIG